MKKKPIALISNDWHVDKDNWQQVGDIISHQCQRAKSLNLKKITVAGDLFESRVSQRQEVFTGMLNILDMVHSHGLTIDIIAGNHDKTDYQSIESFLDPYKYHPAVHLISTSDHYTINGVTIHLMPYFAEKSDIFRDILTTVIDATAAYEKNVLISHFAVSGSVNNDGSEVANNIGVSDFDCFDLVLLGHYHNTHKVSDKIIHMPSIKQKNFGENQLKGFTLLYDDLSYEFVQSNATKYEVYQFDLTKHSLSDMIDVANQLDMKDKKVRFEIIGAKDAVSTLNTEKVEVLGIDIRRKYDALEIKRSEQSESEVKVYTESSIKERFIAYCNEERFDLEEGNKLLNKIILKSNGKR